MINNENSLYYGITYIVIGIVLLAISVYLLISGQVIIQTGSQYDGQMPFEDRVRRELQGIDTKGINPDYILTVALEETGWGYSKPCIYVHNLFSFTDDEHGFLVNKRGYKIYETEAESIQDYVRLLSKQQRYVLAYKAAIMDQRLRFFAALQQAGYAEDHQYARKLEDTFQAYKHREVAQRLSQSEGMDDRNIDHVVSKRIYNRQCLGGDSQCLVHPEGIL